jgi:hypothetical protein
MQFVRSEGFLFPKKKMEISALLEELQNKQI